MKFVVAWVMFCFVVMLMGIVYGATATLSWQDNSNNEDGFKIERALGQTGTFAEVGQVAIDVITFVDTTPDNQLYCYRVRAFNAAGDSSYSTVACGTALTYRIRITIP